MADQDFKYAIEDLTNVYIGARWSYAEMLDQADIPHKFKIIVSRIILTEVAQDTTPENHIFYMTKDSGSYRAYKQMKARFRMSVWRDASERTAKRGKAKSGYESREYPIDEIIDSVELHRKKDTIIVEEIHISKLGLAGVVV